MFHSMSLNNSAFFGIKSSKQTIEVRLNDEKRQAIKVGDNITFSLLPDKKEEITVKVIQLLTYPTFKELFSNISLEDWNAKDWTIQKCVKLMNDYYSKEEIQKYGVVGIRISI